MSRGGHGTSDPDAPEPSGGADWATVRRLAPYLWRFRARVGFAMALLVGAKIANVATPYLLKLIVDDLDDGGTRLAVPVGLLLLYGILRFSTVGLGELRDLVFGRVTESAMRSVALAVFQHLHRLDLDFHLSRRTGGLSRDIERGVGGIRFLLRFMLFNIVPTLLEIGMVTAILLAAFGARYAAVIAVAVVVYVAFSVVVTEWRTSHVRRMNTMDSRANTRAIDSLLNFETVKYFGNEAFEANQYDRNLAHWQNAMARNRASLASLNGGQALIIAVAVTVMMLMAGNAVAAGQLTVGDLVMVNAYLLQLFVPLNFLGFVYREIKQALANMARMFELMDVEPKVTDAQDAVALAPGPAPVQFENVVFGYRSDRRILDGVSFTIPAGHTVAVVGASGAGKSTLARLLFRFYDVDGGCIRIGGQDVRALTQDSLHANIGVVPQDTVLFNDTLGYNIGYGAPGAGEAAIRRAAHLAHLDAFIERAPDGLDTLVGERGLKLSGGEKQRVAIARTILKNPGILIFDEATSSLDSAAEQAIVKAMDEVAESRTTLIIAHRLSTVVNANRIIVLDDGRIVEQGSHGELLAAGGAYHRLWQLQQRKDDTSALPAGVTG